MLPRPARLVLPIALTAVAVLPLVACAGGDAETDTAAADSATAPAAVAEAPAATEAAAPLSEADLDVYQRALTAEVELLREAVAKRAAAKTNADTLSAMMAATDMQSMPAAAERAGIDVSRYRALDEAFGSALSARMMNPAMQNMAAQADTSYFATLPAEQAKQQREQFLAGRRQMEAAFGDSATYRAVPPALRDAFKARAAAGLDSLWRQRFELRAKAAGLGR